MRGGGGLLERLEALSVAQLGHALVHQQHLALLQRDRQLVQDVLLARRIRRVRGGTVLGQHLGRRVHRARHCAVHLHHQREKGDSLTLAFRIRGADIVYNMFAPRRAEKGVLRRELQLDGNGFMCIKISRDAQPKRWLHKSIVRKQFGQVLLLFVCVHCTAIFQLAVGRACYILCLRPGRPIIYIPKA